MLCQTIYSVKPFPYDILDNALHSRPDHVPRMLNPGVEHATLTQRTHSVSATLYKTNNKNVFKYKLNNLQYNKDMFSCNNVFCADQRNDINANILQCIIEIEKANIPAPSHTHIKRAEYVEHICWKDEGHPLHGETSQMFRLIRAQYSIVVNIMVKRTVINLE